MEAPFAAGRNWFRRCESNICSKLLFETNDSVDSSQLTTTCCNSRWRPSERWTRGAQTERVRAATSATERIRAVWADARARIFFQNTSPSPRREVCCLLLLVGARPIVRRCIPRDCWPVIRHLASVYARSESRSRPSNRAHSPHRHGKTPRAA